MTTRTAEARADAHAGPASADEIGELATTFSDLIRSYVRSRKQYLMRARQDLEWASHALISCVVAEGPARVTTLAEDLHADPSTVSRQVAQLVRDGLLERQADPADGRVSLLVVTAKGRRAHADQLRQRDEHFRQMLDGWSTADVRRFTTLLRRFAADFETSRKSWFDEDEPARDAMRPVSQRES